MPGKSILSQNQKDILAIISKDKLICDNFYLTGGTALAEFYLHHRLSEDLDFFSENEFYFKARNAKIKFVTDTFSKVDRLFQYQDGQFFEASRLKDETPIKINPDFFDRLTGKYDFGNNYTIEIVKENDRLFILTPYMPKYELLPTSELDYFAMEVASKISFILNKEGKAESLNSTFDGMILPAKRLVD